VNPATGRRDLDIPATLTRSRGHSDMGLYAIVKSAGRVRAGDGVKVA
jgi:MOSC domain-containing protein YiiM